MAPASAAHRGRGHGVRTDHNARTRKGESDYSAGIEMALADDSDDGPLEQGVVPPSQAAAPTDGTRHRHALLLLKADLTVVLGEDFAPQEREEARQVFGIKIPA